MTKNGKQINKCVNCVNCIQINKNNLFECDLGYFQNATKTQVMIYIPILFECINFERIKYD